MWTARLKLRGKNERGVWIRKSRKRRNEKTKKRGGKASKKKRTAAFERKDEPCVFIYLLALSMASFTYLLTSSSCSAMVRLELSMTMASSACLSGASSRWVSR